MPRKPVSEFFVIPPEARHAEIQRSAEYLKAHMERFFPRYTFVIDPGMPFEGSDEFTLIPVMGTVGEGSEMFEMPSSMEVLQMQHALRDFRPGAGLN